MKNPGYALITGGAGFIGSNLANALLTDREQVVVLDNFSRPGVQRNVTWLKRRHGEALRVERADVRNADEVRRLVSGAREIYHLASQVAVTTSIEDPRLDLDVNLMGTFNVLEAARRLGPPPPILFSSTNKVYGALSGARTELNGGGYRYVDGRLGVDESAALDFHSPYGCSKGAADQYVRDYARIYGVPTVVFRLSCIFGERQFGTEDQGWVAHFARSVLAGVPITVYGDGRQVRDVLYVGDLVRAMRLAMSRIDRTAGEVFNIGGGPPNAVSLLEVLDHLFAAAGDRPPLRMAGWRPGDQKIYVSDTSKAKRVLGWAPTISWTRGVQRLLDWVREPQAQTEAIPHPAAVFHERRRLAARAVS